MRWYPGCKKRLPRYASKRPLPPAFVVELHSDGYVRVYGGDEPVTVSVVNRPHSEFDLSSATVNEIINRRVARKLTYRHRQIYENGWCVADGLQETRDVHDEIRIMHNVMCIRELRA